jgi:hypothetical protein
LGLFDVKRVLQLFVRGFFQVHAITVCHIRVFARVVLAENLADLFGTLLVRVASRDRS